jgi:hypothetical protein
VKKFTSVKSTSKTTFVLLGFEREDLFVSFDETMIVVEQLFANGILVNENATQIFPKIKKFDG